MIKSILVLIAAFSMSLPVSAQVSWQPVYTSGAGYYSIASTQNGNLYARKDTSTLISTAGGAAGTWMPLTTAPSAASAEIYANSKVLLTLGGNGVMRSLDYGATWQFANNGLIGSDSNRLVGLVALDSTHWVLLHRGSSVRKVMVSDNNGASWYTSLNMISQSVVSVLSDGAGFVWLITTSKVYGSNNGGTNWNDLNAVLPAGGAGKTVRLADGSFLLRNSSGFYKSTNQGVSWVPLSSTGIPANTFAAQFIKSPASDTLYMSIQAVSTNTYGLYSSADKGVTWTAFDNGLPANVKLNSSSFASQLHIASNGYLFASPDSADIYRTANPVTASVVILDPTGVGSSAVLATQSQLRLYPNPSGGMLYLSFDQKSPVVREIIVRNATGQVVLTAQPSGLSRDILDVSSLAAGCYFIQVNTGTEVFNQSFIRE